MQLKVVSVVDVFISHSVRSREIQHAPIFILIFNLIFHLTLFGETPFGRDSDFFTSELRDNLIKLLCII